MLLTKQFHRNQAGIDEPCHARDTKHTAQNLCHSRSGSVLAPVLENATAVQDAMNVHTKSLDRVLAAIGIIAEATTSRTAVVGDGCEVDAQGGWA